MRPWMMALASGIAALAAAAALAAPALTAGSPEAVLQQLAPLAPVLIVALVGVYAFAAMLFGTATLIGTVLATRRRVANLLLHRNASELDWLAAFGTTGLRRLALPLAPWTSGRPALVLARDFSAPAARREVARLHYVWLARTQFFGALVVLAGLAVLGLVQRQQPIPLLPFAIPIDAAAVVLAAALLFVALGRLALDIAAESLFETMSRLPVEHPETVLLRRAVELLENGRAPMPMPVPAEDAGVEVRQFAEQVIAVIDHGQRALLAAIGDLSERVGAVGPALDTAVAGLDGALRALTPALPAGDGGQMAELRAAIETLTAVLGRFAAVTEAAEEDAAAGAASPAPASPRLARELRQLLREIETAR